MLLFFFAGSVLVTFGCYFLKMKYLFISFFFLWFIFFFKWKLKYFTKMKKKSKYGKKVVIEKKIVYNGVKIKNKERITYGFE